nr:RecName: Full=24 kDa cell wall protein [Daucus carota]
AHSDAVTPLPARSKV